jgi:hypothetical protein
VLATPLQGSSRMRRLLPTLSVAMVLAAGALVSAQVSIGIKIGAPPPPRAYKVPPQRNPNQEWVEGRWEPQGSKYKWHNGQWVTPPRSGAYWQEPYYDNGRYYKGSWQGGEANGSRGRQEPHSGTGSGTGGREGR